MIAEELQHRVPECTLNDGRNEMSRQGLLQQSSKSHCKFNEELLQQSSRSYGVINSTCCTALELSYSYNNHFSAILGVKLRHQFNVLQHWNWPGGELLQQSPRSNGDLNLTYYSTGTVLTNNCYSNARGRMATSIQRATALQLS